MRVAVVGAGTLGRVYGARLAACGEDVAFVVRPERAEAATPFVVEQVNGPKRRDVIPSPRRVVDIPEDTELVLVTVRFDQLVDAAPDDPGRARPAGLLADRLRAGPEVPVLLITPVMPPQRAALEQTIGRRVISAMPSVVGYLDDRDVVRYWIPAITSTLIDDAAATPEHRAALDQLARHLTNGDVPTRLDRDVATQNAATSTAFFPLIAAIDAGSGVDGVLANKALLTAALEAAKESEAFAHRIGRVAPWAGLLTRFVGPFTLKPGVALARRLFPESVRFVEHHFGAKLHEQHLRMGATILAMARDAGVSMPALERLMAMIEARPAARG